MRRMLETLMEVFNPHRSEIRPPPRPVDRIALRERMKREDPDFARVSQLQHDAMQPLTAKSIRDGLSIRRERIFWEKHGGQGGK